MHGALCGETEKTARIARFANPRTFRILSWLRPTDRQDHTMATDGHDMVSDVTCRPQKHTHGLRRSRIVRIFYVRNGFVPAILAMRRTVIQRTKAARFPLRCDSA
jgi:hypothetical protein